MSLTTTTAPVFLTVREAAKYLHICERTMRELIAFNAIPYYRTGGIKKGRILIKLEDLEAYLQLAGGPGFKNTNKGGRRG